LFLALIIVLGGCGKKNDGGHDNEDGLFPYEGNYQISDIYYSPEHGSVPYSAAIENEIQPIIIARASFESSTMSTSMPVYDYHLWTMEQIAEIGITEEFIVDFGYEIPVIIVTDESLNQRCILIIVSEDNLLYVSNSGYVFSIKRTPETPAPTNNISG
jgi:hypothetical protein